MIRLIGRSFLVLALLFSVGGHWVVLQSAAWATMLVGHVQEGSLTSAITKTFDGKYGCRLCRAVDEGTEKQSRTDRTAPDLKLKIELIAEEIVAVVLVSKFHVEYGVIHHEVALRRTEPPLSQPPRAV